MPSDIPNDLPHNYEVLDLLGRGGMGVVYKARQKSLNRLVAIKVLPRVLADDEFHFVERFKQEAQTIAQFNHPAIIHVHDFGETNDGLLYFVMELVDGRDVAAVLAKEGPFSAARAIDIAKSVCDALHYAHSRGVIHRDIKPANVLIDNEGNIKVADFGLAKMNDPSQASGLTRTNVAMGTQEFAAPEMLTPGAAVDHRADLYSLGVMLYQMLTGEVPRVMFKLPSRCRPELGTRFDAMICKALETDPADRFQSTMEFRRELESVASASAPSTNPSTSVKPGSRLGRFKVISAAVAAMVLFGAGGWYFLGHRHGQALERITTNAPALSSSTLPHNEWIKLLNTPEAVARSGIKGLEWKEGWLTVTPERLYLFGLAGGKGKVHDMAFRGTVRPPTNGRPVAVVLHTGGDLEFFLDVHREWLTLRRIKHLVSSKREDTDLGKVPLDLREAKDGALQLEVSIQGTLITIMANGAKMMEVRDEVAAGVGDIALVAPSETNGSGQIKDLAFKLLDAAQNKVITANEPASEARAIRVGDGAAWTPVDLRNGGWLAKGDGFTTDKQIRGYNVIESNIRDAAVRMTYLLRDASGVQITARGRVVNGKVEKYVAEDELGALQIGIMTPNGLVKRLAKEMYPPGMTREAEHTLEFRIVGGTLTATLNGTFSISAKDDTLTEGSWAMVLKKGALVKALDVQTPQTARTELATPALGKVIDLLALVDVKRDAILGEWSRTVDGLAVPRSPDTANGSPRLQLPFTPPEEYDFEMEFTTGEGNGFIAQALSAERHPFTWTVDLGLQAGKKAGFGTLNGTPLMDNADGSIMRERLLINGRRHVSRVEVRKGKVLGYLDGEKLVDWGSGHSDFAQFDIPPKCAMRDAQHLGIVASDRAVTFHKITVREVGDAAAQDVSRPLFDGKSLDGWLALNGTSPPDGWGVIDGAMTGKPYSAVLTREEFGNFELTLEWRVNPQGNGGIFYRVSEDGMIDHPLHAVEFNLMDESIAAPPLKLCGAAFGVKAPSLKAAWPTGEWNTARLLVQGTKVEQWINEKLVCSYDLTDASVRNGLEIAKIGSEFANVKKGRIALQDWQGEAFYRNVRIRVLP